MHSLRKCFRSVVVVHALFTASLAAYAGDKGYFGFALSIDADGFFNPTLKSVTIDKVSPGSPAESAGLIKGDQFIEVEGRAVAGAKADDVKPYLSRNVGESANFKVRRVSGEVVTVTLTAAKKP
jgi:S1-C subfamily serine protease